MSFVKLFCSSYLEVKHLVSGDVMLCLESEVYVTFGVYKQLKTHLHFFDDFCKIS